MARDVEPSSRKQFMFIVTVLVCASVALYLLSFELPDQARKLAYMMAWIVVLGGTFYVAEKIVRGMLGKK